MSSRIAARPGFARSGASASDRSADVTPLLCPLMFSVTTPEPRGAHGRAVPAGRGPVLMLHGQPGGARDWERVIAALGPDTPAMPINRPGWGGASGRLSAHRRGAGRRGAGAHGVAAAAPGSRRTVDGRALSETRQPPAAGAGLMARSRGRAAHID